MFTFGDQPAPDIKGNLGFAGFRIHGPINRPDYFDEIGVFLGASYFRAVAKGQTYGLSARGLSLNTADPKGEEFPDLQHLLDRAARQGRELDRGARAARQRERGGGLSLHHPAGRDHDLRHRGDAVSARADRAAGPRDAHQHVSSSAPNDRGGVDDFRPAVHDSDGLAIQNGRGEQIWRPLSNPTDLQVSAFVDNNPRGFGLMQRQRDFRAYEDLEARYEKRPSAWVEPIGDWGEGAVHLVEIPTSTEINDNIVAFWRPRNPTRAKGEYTYTYRIHWGAQIPKPLPLAQVIATRIGAGPEETRLIVIDFAGENLKGVPPADIKAHGHAPTRASVRNVVVASESRDRRHAA